MEPKNEKQKSNSLHPDDKSKTTVLKTEKASREKNLQNAETKISDPIHIEEKSGEVHQKPETEDVKIKKKNPNSSLYAAVLATVYAVLVILFAVGISVFAINVANEAFALQSFDDPVPVDVTLTGDHITIEELAKQLHDQKIIRYENIFKIYAKMRHKDDRVFLPGEYKNLTLLSYDALLSAFLPPVAERKQISVTVPEGFTVDDIIKLFVSKGIGTKEAFVEVINHYEFDTEIYWFLEGLHCDNGRIYRLEGYLYPDTYFFYDSYEDEEGDLPGTAAAKAVITKMLNQFGRYFKKSYLEKHKEYIVNLYPEAASMTLDEIITLASILEKEGLAEERSLISAVFYNRLYTENPETGKRLESNATVQYVLRHLGIEVSKDFGKEEMEFPSPYNTYLNVGFPPGPITTPTMDSINAALYPEQNVEYYYFVTSSSGYSFFSKTYEEHKQRIEDVKNGLTPQRPDENEG